MESAFIVMTAGSDIKTLYDTKMSLFEITIGIRPVDKQYTVCYDESRKQGRRAYYECHSN